MNFSEWSSKGAARVCGTWKTWLVNDYYTRKFVDLIWEVLEGKMEYRIDYEFRLRKHVYNDSTWGFDIKLKKYNDKEYFGLYYWDSNKSLYHLCNFEEVKKHITEGIEKYSEDNKSELRRYEHWHW